MARLAVQSIEINARQLHLPAHAERFGPRR